MFLLGCCHIMSMGVALYRVGRPFVGFFLQVKGPILLCDVHMAAAERTAASCLVIIGEFLFEKSIVARRGTLFSSILDMTANYGHFGFQNKHVATFDYSRR